MLVLRVLRVLLAQPVRFPARRVIPDLRVRKETQVIRALLVQMVTRVLPGRKASQVPQVLQVLPEKTV
jgi:hypothetical protein